MKCTIKETKPSGEVKEEAFVFDELEDKPEVEVLEEEHKVAPGPTAPVVKLASVLALVLGSRWITMK